MPDITLSPGLTLHFGDFHPEGNPVVLLLHGLGSNGTSWALQVPALTGAGFRVITPDARGFGKSSYPGGRISIQLLAEDLNTLLTRLNMASAHVVGISLGGVIALQMALDYPESVDRLVLVNTFARLRPRNLGVWLYYIMRALLVFTTGIAFQARRVSHRIFPYPEQEPLRQILYQQILEADPGAYRHTMVALARFDVRDRLARVQPPTMVLTGGADTTVPPANQRELGERIPDAYQKTLPSAGHAMIADHPELFNRILLSFLVEGLKT